VRPRLSVVLIVKDEAERIEECLGELAWADEIVVLDTGSTDGTPDRARPLATTLFQINSWPGFGRARQVAESHATGQWVLMVDGDERISPELREDIQRAVERNDRTVVYSCRVQTWCFGRRIRFGGWSSFWVTRLYPRGVGRWNDALVHERLLVSEGTKRVKLKGHLKNYTYRTREECETTLARYAKDWAEERRDPARGPQNLPGPVARATWTFVRSYVLRLGFLDGRVGWILAVAQAGYTRRKYELLLGKRS